MYYLFKKSKSSELPEFDYIFKSFADFYEIAKVLDVSIYGSYHIKVKTDSYKEVKQFVDSAESYRHLVVYIEVNDSLLSYIQLTSPGVSLLTSKSNFETFKELIQKHSILFDKNCIKLLYFAIGHSYAEMEEALTLIKTTYPDKSPIKEDDISKLFVIDKLVYPRSVCIMYLRLDRGRKRNLERSIEYFGNDIVLYAIRKNVRQLFDEKSKYLRTGQGSNLIKTIPLVNILNMLKCMDYERDGFKDIRTILTLYEKGVSINDFVQKRTLSPSDEEHNDVG